MSETASVVLFLVHIHLNGQMRKFVSFYSTMSASFQIQACLLWLKQSESITGSAKHFSASLSNTCDQSTFLPEKLRQSLSMIDSLAAYMSVRYLSLSKLLRELWNSSCTNVLYIKRKSVFLERPANKKPTAVSSLVNATSQQPGIYLRVLDETHLRILICSNRCWQWKENSVIDVPIKALSRDVALWTICRSLLLSW